jgi:antitoxin CptB
MTEQTEYARLRWQCRRGMRELDAVLEEFLATSFGSLSDADKSHFTAILELPDPELYGYLAGRMEPPDQGRAALVARIRAHAAFRA